ncbi:nitroreductase/quinone reductase family protein [Kutzneria kofuensis]|jgi:deazaflavin-dependent oxidoreductase (nitroreductase family)|uniref:Deazaflavin-dependent oxidoreductase (Nitroreductase family) n=1 Tax=Kutzneria kofuensis TaxID=103725 RepID=A0A7W9KLI5_9PSEU|nr:nitroreductase/quinone reductase family protein [Kutzneria kofuensis]MBB5894793.1 deazaflavin-dependent oxidoreductase (nitroreductase family) [Kutzneria kofuensis]
MSEQQDFNRTVIEEFRANGGRVGGRLADVDLVLVTHTGARTGRKLTTPLGHVVDGDDLVVVAANRGSANHPSWYHNLVANPDVTVEVGAATYPAKAIVATGAERSRLWDKIAALKPFLLDFQEKAGAREIPIVVLRRA